MVTVIIACNLNHSAPTKSSPNVRYIPIKIPSQRFYAIQRV
jgi:hypothetical protein